MEGLPGRSPTTGCCWRCGGARLLCAMLPGEGISCKGVRSEGRWLLGLLRNQGGDWALGLLAVDSFDVGEELCMEAGKSSCCAALWLIKGQLGDVA